MSKKKTFVRDVMLNKSKFAIVNEQTIVFDTLKKMSFFKIGIACVEKNNKLYGVFTDGDLRRKILKKQMPFAAYLNEDIKDYVNKKPTSIKKNTLLEKAIELMERKKIWDLPVVDNKNNLAGLLHLHPAIKHLLKKNKK